MSEESKNSNSVAIFISFLAGLAVGAGAILFVENSLENDNENDYETEQLFV